MSGFTRRCLIFLVIALTFSLVKSVHAEDYTSSNFIDRDPVVLIQGGRSTSTNFELISGSGQTVIGEATSTNFLTHSGFFYFPSITTPALSASAGDGTATLTWTTAEGALGYIVSGYQVGQSAVSGGPYSFTNVGNVLTSERTGLANGTTYYFVVRVLDSLSDAIATSTQTSATPVASTTPPPSGGGGGGGGGGVILPTVTQVVFSGRAYPNSSVTLLKDAQVSAITVAGPDAKFEIALSGLTGGNYIFTLYGKDLEGRRSSLFTYPITLTVGATTRVSGIFISPTISVDKTEVRQGDNIAIFGQSAPVADIVISVNSDSETFVKTKSDKEGVYLYNFDTAFLELGQHYTKSKAAVENEISQFGKTVGFLVGDRSVEIKKISPCPSRADLNSDCRVNLVDFSIAAYWYKRPLNTAFRRIEKDKLNGDGRVTLVDFSIMAYYWTG